MLKDFINSFSEILYDFDFWLALGISFGIFLLMLAISHVIEAFFKTCIVLKGARKK